MSESHWDRLQFVLRTSSHRDINIFGADGSVTAHQAVLAAISPFLRVVLADQSKESVIFLPQFSARTIYLLLSLIYIGEVHASEEELRQLSDLGDMLQLHIGNCSVDPVQEGQQQRQIQMTFNNPVVEKVTVTVPAYQRQDAPAAFLPQVPEMVPPSLVTYVTPSDGHAAASAIAASAVNTKFEQHIYNQGSSVPIYSCDMCNARYIDKCEMYIHKLDHYPRNALMCPICGNKGYGTRNGFVNHIRSHMDQDMLTCQICSKTFANKAQTMKHMKIHSSPLYTCQVCSKVFVQMSHLQGHMKTHTIKKPFPCEVCGRIFKRNDHLFYHMKIHTGEKPFQCQTCGQSFRRKHHVTKHMKLHLRQENQQPPVEEKQTISKNQEEILCHLSNF